MSLIWGYLFFFRRRRGRICSVIPLLQAHDGAKMGFVMEVGCRSTWRWMIQHRIIIGKQNDRFTYARPWGWPHC
ncbi:uncharacterized protein BKA55DRAFT_559807 [Fusarium redolens]|uniref:Uncharacterized protein n=1 Tax=Fusarium redolens TaxID=48865 RepID=A0A9P9HPH5_FUSRE|nr:uncharacterized protein BKA55DRAFT_559807 [Fusarium redolens]KAH7260807.1 hypothetical protein BKA55DRAFT_559807 [Fusarium redolens]